MVQVKQLETGNKFIRELDPKVITQLIGTKRNTTDTNYILKFPP